MQPLPDSLAHNPSHPAEVRAFIDRLSAHFAGNASKSAAAAGQSDAAGFARQFPPQPRLDPLVRARTLRRPPLDVVREAIDLARRRREGRQGEGWLLWRKGAQP